MATKQRSRAKPDEIIVIKGDPKKDPEVARQVAEAVTSQQDYKEAKRKAGSKGNVAKEYDKILTEKEAEESKLTAEGYDEQAAQDYVAGRQPLLPSQNKNVREYIKQAVAAGYDRDAVVSSVVERKQLLPSENRNVREFTATAKQYGAKNEDIYDALTTGKDLRLPDVETPLTKRRGMIRELTPEESKEFTAKIENEKRFEELFGKEGYKKQTAYEELFGDKQLSNPAGAALLIGSTYVGGLGSGRLFGFGTRIASQLYPKVTAATLSLIQSRPVALTTAGVVTYSLGSNAVNTYLTELASGQSKGQALKQAAIKTGVDLAALYAFSKGFKAQFPKGYQSAIKYEDAIKTQYDATTGAIGKATAKVTRVAAESSLGALNAIPAPSLSKRAMAAYSKGGKRLSPRTLTQLSKDARRQSYNPNVGYVDDYTKVTRLGKGQKQYESFLRTDKGEILYGKTKIRTQKTGEGRDLFKQTEVVNLNKLADNYRSKLMTNKISSAERASGLIRKRGTLIPDVRSSAMVGKTRITTGQISKGVSTVSNPKLESAGQFKPQRGTVIIGDSGQVQVSINPQKLGRPNKRQPSLAPNEPRNLKVETQQKLDVLDPLDVRPEGRVETVARTNPRQRVIDQLIARAKAKREAQIQVQQLVPKQKSTVKTTDSAYSGPMITTTLESGLVPQSLPGSLAVSPKASSLAVTRSNVIDVQAREIKIMKAPSVLANARVSEIQNVNRQPKVVSSVDIRTTARTSVASISAQNTQQKVSPISLQDKLYRQVLKPDQATRLRSTSRSTSVQLTSSRVSVPSLSRSQLTTPKPKTPQIPKPVLRVPSPRVPVTKIEVPKPPQLTNRIRSPPSPKLPQFRKFATAVRVKGKFQRVSSPTSSLDQAFGRGLSYVRNKAQATFKVIDLTSGKPVEYTKSIKGFYTKTPGVYTQNRNQRITTQGEKREITYKGLSVKSGKGLYGVATNIKKLFRR